jgi:hypothetical protein
MRRASAWLTAHPEYRPDLAPSPPREDAAVDAESEES